jgi:phosphonate transport system substrate-binding protein
MSGEKIPMALSRHLQGVAYGTTSALTRIFTSRPSLCRQVFFVLMYLLVTSCITVYAEKYTLSMLPRYSTEEIHKRITILAEYLSEATSLNIEPVVISTFDQYQQQILGGAVNIGFENPYIYVLTSREHDVIALAEKKGSGARFRGVIITRADSPLQSMQDLRGKTVSIVGYTSAGGFLSQKLSLSEGGIDVVKSCRLIEAANNKQENVILSVYTGDVDAGFIRESALHRADGFVPATALKVLSETAWLPNWAVSVSKTMPSADREKITRAILALDPSSPVSLTLKINRFLPAVDDDYSSVRRAAGIEINNDL